MAFRPIHFFSREMLLTKIKRFELRELSLYVQMLHFQKEMPSASLRCLVLAIFTQLFIFGLVLLEINI